MKMFTVHSDDISNTVYFLVFFCLLMLESSVLQHNKYRITRMLNESRAYKALVVAFLYGKYGKMLTWPCSGGSRIIAVSCRAVAGPRTCGARVLGQDKHQDGSGGGQVPRWKHFSWNDVLLPRYTAGWFNSHFGNFKVNSRIIQIMSIFFVGRPAAVKGRNDSLSIRRWAPGLDAQVFTDRCMHILTK